MFDLGKAEFWERVAFYNFVQSFAGGAARVRPKAEQLSDAASQRAFQQVLDELRPERILVLGKSTWEWLPSDTEVLAAAPVAESRLPLPEIFGKAHEVDQTAYWYSWRPKGRALAFPIRHPSEFGFRPQHWKVALQLWLNFDEG